MRITAFICLTSSLLIGANSVEMEDPENFGHPTCSELEETDSSIYAMEKGTRPPQKPLWNTKRKPCNARSSKNSIQSSPLDPSTPDVIFPTGRNCPIESPGGVRTYGALLIWQSKMWGFEFAGKSSVPTNAGTPSLSLKEKAFVPDFAWRPGFKLDVGYDFDFDGWDLDSRWTYYKGEDTSLKKNFISQTNPPGMGIEPLWFYPFYNVISPNQIRFFQGTMSWRHYFNSIDLEIGRSSSLNDRLSMRLYGGLKGAWMRQYYRVNYHTGTTISAIVPGTDGTVSFELLESASAFKNETWGAGPRAGLESRWKIRWGFSLIADASLSLLYSEIETHRDQNDLNLNVALGTQQPFHVHIITNSHQLKPVAEAKLGLDWKKCIYSRSIIGVLIGYEIQYWWAQNALRRNYTHAAPGDMFPMRGDLQMHGLTAEVSYSY